MKLAFLLFSEMASCSLGIHLYNEDSVCGSNRGVWEMEAAREWKVEEMVYG